MARKKTQFETSLINNVVTYKDYLEILTNIAISRFVWENLPESCDSGMLERTLYMNGTAIFCEDDVIGILSLPYTYTGGYDVYGKPTKRRAYSLYNSYIMECGEENSVIVYNNILRLPNSYICEQYAKRLYLLDRIIDINVNAQKTPVLLQGTEKQKMTLNNLYMKYDGNVPFIFGDKNMDFGETIKTINTGAPYIAGNLMDLKNKVWNECLTYLGVPNVGYTKKERMIRDEVERAQGGALASRASYLEAREKAVEELNRKFGLDVSVKYREFKESVTIQEYLEKIEQREESE